MKGNEHYLKEELYGLIKKEDHIFDFIQESALDGLWYWDLEKPENEWMNARFWEVLGYYPETMPHKASAWQHIINQEDLKTSTDNFVKHCEDPNHPYDQVVRYQHKNGSTVWIRCRGMAIRNEIGKPLRMLGAHHNVTEIKSAELALKESEERFKTMFYKGGAVKLVIDQKTGNILDANPAAIKYYGYPDLLSLKIQQINQSSETMITKRMLEAEQEMHNHFIFKHKLASGEIRDVEVYSTPLKLNDRILLLSIVHDITSRIEAENLLKDSEEKYRLLAENATDEVWFMDLDFKFKYISPATEKLLGYTLEERKQISVEQLFTEDTLIKLKSFVNDKAKDYYDTGNHDTYILETEAIHKNGHIVFIEVAAKFIFNKNGEIIGIQGSSRNVTEKKIKEQELQEQLKFSKALNRIAESIIESDNKEELLNQANNIIGETLQLDRSLIYEVSFKEMVITGLCEWLKKGHSDIEPTKGEYPVDILISPLSEIRKTKKLLISQYDHIVNPFIDDGSGKLLHEHFKIKSLIWYPFAFEKDRFYIFTLNQILHKRIWSKQEIGFIGSVARQVNIAIIKIGLLEERKGNEDILQKKNNELFIAKEKAEESDRLKSAFLSNMSHEIRTPMNGILGFTQIIKDPDISLEEIEEYLKIIERSGDRMLNTINDIIDISQIEAGQVDLKLEKVSVEKIMEEQYLFFKAEARKKGLDFSCETQLNEELEYILTDKYKLEGVLINLIKNALKYTKTGKVEFGCAFKETDEHKFLEFYVSDTGIGISENRINAVFNRFEQAEIKEAREYEGSGLGLAISKAYVEMLNGKIWVTSKKGRGSTFRFTIPID